MNWKHRYQAALVAGVSFAATGAVVLATPPSGITPTPLVTAVLEETTQFNSDPVKYQTKDATAVRMVKQVLAAGATSGWHHHEGVALVAVQAGSVQVWKSDCSKKTYGPGKYFVEAESVHQVTSEGGATIYVTNITRNAASPIFRIDDQAPFCTLGL